MFDPPPKAEPALLRAIEWMGRWGRYGGTLGLDAQGRVGMGLLEGDPHGDPVAEDMAAELMADQALEDGVAAIMLRCSEEDKGAPDA